MPDVRLRVKRLLPCAMRDQCCAVKMKELTMYVSATFRPFAPFDYQPASRVITLEQTLVDRLCLFLQIR